jgi:hypothetical protein
LTIKLVFVSSPLSKQHYFEEERTQTGRLEKKMMCPSEATCLPVDISLFQYQAGIIIISSNVTCSRHAISEKLLILTLNNNYSLTVESGVKTQ